MASIDKASANVIAFVWDNFGPMHVDRCEAVASHPSLNRAVVGIELFLTSSEYEWAPEGGKNFQKITVFRASGSRQSSGLLAAWKVVEACLNAGATDVFICNYDRTYLLMAATLLRISGRRVYVMGCSKFDDLERRVRKEYLKSFFLWPYQGAIASGIRSRDYFKFLGIAPNRVVSEYNTLSIERIRRDAGVAPAPGGPSFEERHFTIIARFVSKKNLAMAIKAYRIYRSTTSSPRRLHLCGSGPLEEDLRALVRELDLEEDVLFLGFLQTSSIARQLGTTLALILPSVEEQFGNVVIEAQALGVPVMLSDNCGARDNLVRSGVNGFVVEADNPEGLAIFMKMISEDSDLWIRMAKSAFGSAEKGDVQRFADGVLELVEK